LPRATATASAPKLTKRSLQPVETHLKEAVRRYIVSIQLLSNTVASLIEKPTSARRLDAVLRARMREVEARRVYQRASKALFAVVLGGQ
jgi:hypothetical protein